MEKIGKESYQIFELNEDKERFQELVIIEGINLSDLLDSEGIIAFIDKGNRRIECGHFGQILEIIAIYYC